MNNLRQHGIAWYLYLDDHEECFPKWGVTSGGGATPYTFGGKGTGPADETKNRILNSYLDIDSDDDKSALEVFHCPDDIKEVTFNQTWFNYLSKKGTFSRLRICMLGGTPQSTNVRMRGPRP